MTLGHRRAPWPTFPVCGEGVRNYLVAHRLPRTSFLGKSVPDQCCHLLDLGVCKILEVSLPL